MYIKSKETGYIYNVIAIDYCKEKYLIHNVPGYGGKEWWPMNRFNVLKEKDPEILGCQKCRNCENCKEITERNENIFVTKINELEKRVKEIEELRKKLLESE